MEIEIKYPTPDQSIFDAIAAQYNVGVPRTNQMYAQYYDTADHALARQKASLRSRRENDKLVWTLKIASNHENGVAFRQEYECLAQTMEHALDILITQCGNSFLAEVLKAQPLQPIVTMDFVRVEARMLFENAIFALSYDKGTMEHGGKIGPISEIEIELKSGLPNVLHRLAAVLEAEYGLKPSSISKLHAARML